MIPWRLRHALEPAALSAGVFAFRRGLRDALTCRLLNMGWKNEGFSADTAYLQTVCEWALRIPGPILECGSGLTTILLGMIAQGRVTSLEHLPEWKERVERTAVEYAIPVDVLATPLVDYGSFDWYSVKELSGKAYELIICDGPPSKTKGGRYGLFPAARHLFAPNAVILMDDVECPAHQATIERWKSEFGIRSQEHKTEVGVYATLHVDHSP
jgi:hypothetical protein